MTALEPSEPSRGARRRLRVAVAARAAIDHPNLVRAWAVGEGDGRLFVAVDRCPHPSLSELLAAPLEPTACVRILAGAAAGVGALSERALVARDLTPERVLVDPEHGGVLMDLGIPGELLRRVPLEQDPDLAFRSPEEFERKPVDVRSGVYSLGALLFTALTGRPPDDYSSRMAETRPRPSEQRAEVSSDVDAVIACAMARDPAERYANPEALARAAAAAVGTELSPRTLPGDVEATQRWQQPPTRRAPLTPWANELTRRANGRPSATAHATRARRISPQRQTHPQPAAGGNPPSPRHAKRRATLPRPHVVTARLRSRRFTSVRIEALSRLSHRKPVLLAVGAIVATALSGITLERALEPEEGPSSITRSGLTVQIPSGWEEVSFDAGRPALSPAIAAGPPEDTNAGFVVGKLGSETAAERMLEGAQAGGGGRTEVRLGKLHAWRYAGLRPRPQLAGTGYLLPTTAGAVVMVCHAAKDDARIRLAECERAATTLVVHGERPRRLASVDRSNERLVGVIATLRARRSGGRQRLALPDLAPSQIGRPRRWSEATA